MNAFNNLRMEMKEALTNMWNRISARIEAIEQGGGGGGGGGVTGVKGDAESSYRQGNVNLTAANIGAASDSAVMQDRGFYPNGQSMFSLAPGYYTTTDNNMPSESFPPLETGYGELSIAKGTGSSQIIFTSALKDFLYWDVNKRQWVIIQREGVTPVTSGGTGATTAAGAISKLFDISANDARNYPNAPGVYRTVGTNIFSNLQPGSTYGVLIIIGRVYAAHFYIDSYSNMFVGYSGDVFGEPTTWKKCTP